MSVTSPWINSVSDEKRYPALKGNESADVAIVGGGIVGVMTAWRLVNEGLSVVILEKNHLGTGDTGYTTGFLTRVPDTDIKNLEERYGASFVKSLFEGSREAQEYIVNLIRSNKIDCDFSDCSSYYYSYEAGILQNDWETIRKADPLTSFQKKREAKKSGAPIEEAIIFKNEGQFNVRKFIFGLLGLQKAKRLKVFEETEVLDMEYREQVTVKTQGGTVSAKQIVIASGLPISSFKELHGIFKAKVTHALTAKYDDGAPISADLFWDTNDPYFYFRRLDASTVILGGEDSYVGTKPTREPHTALSNFLRKHFDGKFTVTNRWSGSLYDSEDGLPYASAHPHYEDRVFIGSCAGFGGNGLVFGTLAASVISDLIVGKENKFSPLLSFSRTSAKIPEPAQKGKGEDTARIFVKVANTGQVQEGEPFCAEANGNKVALFKSGSEFYALSNTCTHAGGSLCEGTLEGKIVQCPLHGAKFDFTDGSLKGPPARKSVESFKTRVVQDSIEVEVGASRVEKEAGMLSTPTVPKKKEVRLFAGARKNPKYVLSASALALAFWLLQFADQYLFLIPGEFEGSIVRSFALSGATLISLALIIGPLRTLTKYNLLAHRRTVGVWGFTFIIMHFITVSVFLFESDLSRLFWDSNPVANPLLFSVGAFPIFVAMWATSTDWAVEKLSFKRWKFLHRLVFLAYIAAVAHYSLINPELLLNPSGYLLISFTVAAFSLELAAFVKTVRRKGFGKGGAIGLLIILFGASVFTAAFGFREEVVGGVEPNPDLPLSMAMVRMTDFMEQQGGNQSVMTEPIEEDMAFEGEMSRSGEFVRVNYMTSGSATLETKEGNSFVVFGDDFSTPNGPDLVVYLTRNTDPSTREDIQQGIILSSLKSTKGKQVYEIPSGVDVEEYNSVTIHCRAFNVPWSYVPFA